VTFPALNQEDEQVAAEEPPPAVDWADREQEPGLEAENPPTPGPAPTPEQRSWALEALRRKMEEPPVSLPTRRGNWGGYEEGGVVYKPSLGSKVVGGIGQFLAAVGGGMDAGERAHEEYFGGPYREALGRAGVTQAMREKHIADLTKAAEEEARMAREGREATQGAVTTETSRKRGLLYDAQAANLGKPPEVALQHVQIDYTKPDGTSVKRPGTFNSRTGVYKPDIPVPADWRMETGKEEKEDTSELLARKQYLETHPGDYVGWMREKARFTPAAQAQFSVLPVVIDGTTLYHPRIGAAGKEAPISSGTLIPLLDEKGNIVKFYNNRTGDVTDAAGIGRKTGKGFDERKAAENANSGLRAIDAMEKWINRDPNVLYKAAIPFAPFAREFNTARREAADVITRLRTGAALNADEQVFYQNQMPTALDSAETIAYKLQSLRSLFSALGGQVTLPPEAASRLQEGVNTRFANGQVWTKKNGQAVQVK
jgi:hypothetical protein